MAATFFPLQVKSFLELLSPVPFSNHFYGFMGRRFTLLFKQGTGLSPSPQVTTGRIDRDSNLEMYIPGDISRLNFRIGIASTVGYDIAFCWKSKSGKIVRIDDEDFDENDLECWLEGLVPEKYYEDLALYTNKKPPFKIKDLPFELDIKDYGYSMDVFVTFKNQFVPDDISNDLNKAIVVHNELASLENDKKPLQAVHNWKITNLEDGRVKVYLDAASPEILKKIVKAVANRDDVRKVEMDLVG